MQFNKIPGFKTWYFYTDGNNKRLTTIEDYEGRVERMVKDRIFKNLPPDEQKRLRKIGKTDYTAYKDEINIIFNDLKLHNEIILHVI